MGTKPREAVDLLIVFSFARVHSYVLNLVKHLAPRFRVGILLAGGESSATLKLVETESQFLGLCEGHGALVFRADAIESVHCNVVLVPQNHTYREGLVSWVRRLVIAEHRLGVQCVYKPLLTFMDNLVAFDLNRFLIFDEQIFDSQLLEAGTAIPPQVSVEKVNPPYVSHPAFDEGEIPSLDYIIAMPTEMLLEDNSRFSLMRTLRKALFQMEIDNSVAIKLHNVRDGGNRRYFSPRGYSSPVLGTVLGMLPRKRWRRWGTAILFEDILRRTMPLSDLTKYSNLNFELFLPFIKKGVLTGISAVMWYALNARIPVFNCASTPFNERTPNFYIYKSFMTAYCRGRLEFDPANYANVGREEEDIVDYVERLLTH